MTSNPDGWTFATLYKHVMALSLAQKEAVAAAMDAAKQAGEKADKATEKRFDAVNEFRNTLKDQQTTFADKESTERRLATLESASSKETGKSQGIWLVAIVAAQIFIIGIALIALFKH